MRSLLLTSCAVLGLATAAKAQVVWHPPEITPSQVTPCTLAYCPPGVYGTANAHMYRGTPLQDALGGTLIDTPKGIVSFWIRAAMVDPTGSPGDLNQVFSDMGHGVFVNNNGTNPQSCENSGLVFKGMCAVFDAVLGVTFRITLEDHSFGPSFTATTTGGVMTVTACSAPCGTTAPITVGPAQLTGASATTHITASSTAVMPGSGVVLGTACGGVPCTGAGGTGTYAISPSQSASVTQQVGSYITLAASASQDPFFWQNPNDANGARNFNARWVHVLCSWDFSASGNPHYACYGHPQGEPNRLLVNTTGVSQIATTLYPALSWVDGIGVGGKIPNASGMTNGSWADMYLNSAQTIIQSGNTILAADLAKFSDSFGNAVDLGATCNAPTGSQPVVCVHGSNMLVNDGYGGTLTPTATTSNPADHILDPAPYGPNGPVAGKPYLNWAAYRMGAGILPVAGNYRMSAASNLITQGDFMLIVCGATNASTADVTGRFNAPTGWLSDPRLELFFNNTTSIRVQGFYKWAGQNEPNAVNITMATNPDSSFQCQWLDFGNVGGIDDAVTISGAAATTWNAPQVTVRNSNDLVVSFYIETRTDTKTGYKGPWDGVSMKGIKIIDTTWWGGSTSLQEYWATGIEQCSATICASALSPARQLTAPASRATIKSVLSLIPARPY